jgi:hypothetical protein
MAGKRQMDRKDFLALTITSVGAGAWLLACGGDDDDGGTGGTGGGGPTAGKGGSGGSGGTGPTGSGGKGGTGPTGSGGTGPTGSGGKGGTGAGGTGAGGAGGTGAGGAGGTGAGGAGAGGAGAGGMSGGAGTAGTGGSGGGSAGGGAGGMGGGMSCMDLEVEQTDPATGHTHIPTGAAGDTFLQALAAHINGPMATMPFTEPSDGTPAHTHTITFTQQEITTLRGGGTVTRRSSMDNGHDHEWELSCG